MGPAAVGSTEQRLVAMFLSGIQDGIGRQRQGLLPGNPHEGFLATQMRLGIASGISQVRLAHHRVHNPRLVVDTLQITFGQHLVGHGVQFRHRLNTYQNTVLDHRPERPPVVSTGNDDGIVGKNLIAAKPTEPLYGHGRSHCSFEKLSSADRHIVSFDSIHNFPSPGQKIFIF